ncbi:MAG: GvpL/GvpF family gas vesicle protein [Chloroflexi bacterium]|nr:GvpL/GvpF family gas vesicle protein [Chloroflexota bacterium]
MSACYLYAIVRAATPQAALDTAGPGLLDMPLQRVAQDGLAAVVSAWHPARPGAAPAADEADVWRHEQVIEALMDRGPTLPVRFGTILADAARVQELLVTRRADFEIDLAHVADRVEMGLRVLWNPPTLAAVDEAPPRQAPDNVGSPAGPGRDYLDRLVTQQRRENSVQAQGRALADELNTQLRPFAADVHIQVLQSERLLLSAVYLVENASVEAFRARIEALRRIYPSLSFLASGPWPAYHFVSDQPEPANTRMP